MVEVDQCSRIREENAPTFFSFQSARRPTPETFTTLKRTPGISPLAFPLRPKPEIRTSSFSSTKFKQPSFLCSSRVSHGVSIYNRSTYGDESRDLLSVLDQLYAHTLADSRVWLLRLDTDLFEYDAFRMRRSSSRRCFENVSESTFLVSFVCLNDAVSPCLFQRTRWMYTQRFARRSVRSLRAA